MGKFGKRIYYDMESGNVILITNDMQGDGIQQLTPQQERDIYVVLSERHESSYSFLQLEFGQHAQEFIDGSATSVDHSTGEITWVWHDPQAVEERMTLEQKVNQLEDEAAMLSLELINTQIRLEQAETEQANLLLELVGKGVL